MPLRRATCLVLIATAAWSADPLVFHVSPAGNDAWSGTQAAATGADGPFATPARARDAIRQARAAGRAGVPVQVVLHDGTYRLAEPLAFSSEDGGTAAAPVTWRAAPSAKPVLSGGRLLTGWTVKDGRWVVDVPPVAADQRGPRRLSMDGRARYRPILPKKDYFRVAGFAGLDPKAKYDTPADRFEYRPGDIDPAWRNPTDIEAVVLHFWVDTHLPLASINGATNTVHFALKSRRKLTDDFNTTGARYYLVNVAEALTEPGEFYWDRAANTVTYIPKPGEDPHKTICELPVLSHLVDIAGASDGKRPVEHLRFEGLGFTGTQWSLPPKDAGDLQAANSVPGAVRVAFARNLSFHKCTFTNLATYGLALNDGSRGIAVTRSEFAHLDAGGIRVNGGDSKSPEHRRTGDIAVEDCHLHDLGETYHSAVGLLFMHADRCRLIHNHVHHLRYSAVSIGWVWGYGPSVSVGNLAEGNDLHDIGMGVLSDMGGIYHLGDGTGTVVRHNRIFNVDSWGYGGWGLYTDEGSFGVLFEDNLVYRTKCASFHQHYGKENILRNNILAFAKEDQLQRTRKEKHLSYTFERNIVYWDPGQNLLGKQPTNWDDDQYALDRNCYWQTGGGAFTFAKWSFEDWKKRGKDVNSVIADPGFANAATGDFRLKADSPALKTGFKPFDLTTFGVRPER